MAELQFENKITSGNLWTIFATVVSVLVAGVWGWGQMQAQIERVSDRVSAIEQTIRERIALADADRAAKEARIRTLEIQASGFGSDLRNIQSGVSRIEASLATLADKKGTP